MKLKRINCYVETNIVGSTIEWSFEVPDDYDDVDIQTQFEIELLNHINSGWEAEDIN